MPETATQAEHQGPPGKEMPVVATVEEVQTSAGGEVEQGLPVQTAPRLQTVMVVMVYNTPFLVLLPTTRAAAAPVLKTGRIQAPGQAGKAAAVPATRVSAATRLPIPAAAAAAKIAVVRR